MIDLDKVNDKDKEIVKKLNEINKMLEKFSLYMEKFCEKENSDYYLELNHNYGKYSLALEITSQIKRIYQE